MTGGVRSIDGTNTNREKPKYYLEKSLFYSDF
jgi:hypothetical protein